MNSTTMQIFTLVLLVLLQAGCSKNIDTPSPEDNLLKENLPSPEFLNRYIKTDKAVYKPGDEVLFTLQAASYSANAKIRYKHLGKTLADVSLPGLSWKWKLPETDFQGYMAEVYAGDGTRETIYASIAIDASSSWTRFPRYGFLSDYSQLSDEYIQTVMENLNRHHINGIQFYDWHNKHHQPMAVDGSSPASKWKDIGGRDIYYSTVKKYIEIAHQYNAKAMFYNLVFGAWENAETDGVKKEWYIFKDAQHSNREVMTLPKPPFLSHIYWLDASNTGWQKYIQNENRKIYQYLDFDGYHMDQLGDWGMHYTYEGEPIQVDKTYKPFIESIKVEQPSKFIAMNAVNQYGQKYIATSPADFLYTEVWAPNDTYADLAYVIQQNDVYSNYSKNTVLAAYMNYELAEKKGFFNTASVLMTNAVIFAFGGAHLELGEHMLGKEYFPNNNLSMKDDLKEALVSYYDFLVAYQNLLRDGGALNQVSVQSEDGNLSLNNWPPIQGSTAVVCKKVGSRQMLHFLNFTGSRTMQWRDNKGEQVTPVQLKECKIAVETDQPVKRVWVASPDVAGAVSRELNFICKDNKVIFVLPELKYWSMVVLEQ